MKKALILVAALGFSGCVMQSPQLPPPDVQAKASSLTPGMVKKHIEVGKTTQADILEIFGPPDMITKSGRGEMWGYDKVSREVASADVGERSGVSAGGGLGLLGGAGGGVLGGVLGGVGGGYGQSSQQSRSTESTKTIFVLVYFDEKNVVTDYKLSATKF